MLDFNERIEACIEELDKQVDAYLKVATQADEDGNAIVALRLGSIAQGMHEALVEIRRVRVPDTLQPIIDELVAERPRVRLRVVGE